MLKPSHLLTQVFDKNKRAQEKRSNHICNFESQGKWREGRSVVSYYLDIETTKNQFRLLNPTPLDCIAGYIMEDAVGGRYLKRLPRIRLNFIDVSISC